MTKYSGRLFGEALNSAGDLLFREFRKRQSDRQSVFDDESTTLSGIFRRPLLSTRRDDVMLQELKESVASANSTAANGCRYFFFQFP
jgi:hypothetical protein